MTNRRKAAGLIVLIAAFVGGLGTLASVSVSRYYQLRPLYLRGAVIKQDDDPQKQSPIRDVKISADDNVAAGPAQSDFSGLFSIRLIRGVGPNRTITLRFRHPDYQPLDLTEPAEDRLAVVHLVPLEKSVDAHFGDSPKPVGSVVIRYSTVRTVQESFGAEAKTFQVQNRGNVPCEKRKPCSPDGKWKAAVASESMDAGESSEFRNARVSCIAGPCPFTKVDDDNFSHGGRKIMTTVRNWSDTTSFVFQAEIFHTQIDSVVRLAYPVILGTSLNFTLPPLAQGPSIEAEIDGENMVFPLGPNPALSWAECNISTDKNQSTFYRCDLKSNYQFQESK